MDDKTHIAEEMYKKNLELAERNKTLSLLRKIDDIILSSVTDIHQVAKEVTTAIVTETGFQLVGIFLQNRKARLLKTLSVYEATSLNQPIVFAESLFSNFSVSLDDGDNLMVHAIKNTSMQLTAELYDIVRPFKTKKEAEELQLQMKVSSLVVFPLVIRGEVSGVLLIGFAEAKKELLPFEKDLVNRLPQVIAIAIDNSLLYQKIQEANNRLRQLDILKDDFVSVASHELRTPMTAIKSYLWMALNGKGGELNEKQKYYLNRSYSATDRLIKLVNDMLNISRIESGRMTFKMQKIDLITLIDDVVEEVHPRADELGINITFNQKLYSADGIQTIQSKLLSYMNDLQVGESLKSSIVPAVIADQDKIKEVLINLIGNSLKFTPRGGQIVISLEKSGNMITTRITDTGKGIEKEDLPKLFKKFGLIQGSYVTNQNVSQGTGLGLFICKSIIDFHKGTIAVASDGRDKGTMVSFSLPIYSEELKNEFESRKTKGEVDLIPTAI